MKITFFNTNLRPQNSAFLLLVLLVTAAITIQSCGDSSTDPVDTYAYVPLDIGQYQIYEIKQETYISGQKTPVITTWQEKDEVRQSSTDVNGIPTFIVSRSRRNTSTDYWQKVKDYSIGQFPDKLTLNLDNQITVPFIFPIDSKIEWNGNMYNTLDKEDYHYEDINQSYRLGTLSFEKALTVVERSDTTSVVSYALGIKRYALGVGLIYDEQTAYQFCQSEDCIGSKAIDSGSKKVRRILEYGNGK